jgi:hypothetical protein
VRRDIMGDLPGTYLYYATRSANASPWPMEL